MCFVNIQYILFSPISDAVTDQEQAMLYEALWEVIEVVRNVIKPGDTPLWSQTGTQGSRPVQIKVLFFPPSLFAPTLCSAPEPLYSYATRLSVLPSLCSSEDIIMLFIL